MLELGQSPDPNKLKELELLSSLRLLLVPSVVSSLSYLSHVSNFFEALLGILLNCDLKYLVYSPDSKTFRFQMVSKQHGR